MNESLDSILYIFFYVFPLLMLFLGRKFKPNLSVFPFPLKTVDLLTPYLLLSVSIQTSLAGLYPANLYFYIILSVLGIIHASYLAFGKKSLVVGKFFRTWWRYVFILTLLYHLVVGAYGLFINFI